MFSSQSSVGARREGGHLELQVNGATVRVPEFIQKMTLQMFHKEAIIQLFLQYTGPEVHNKFLLCSPEEQYVLVLSFFLHAGAWGDFSTAFLQTWTSGGQFGRRAQSLLFLGESLGKKRH